jgi:hypothetical protein
MPGMPDDDITATIFSLLDARRAGATICPSDVARALSPTDEAAWRSMMPAVREVAARLASADRLRVTRGGVVVDAQATGGPIRLGRP